MKLVFFQQLLSCFKTDSCEPAVYTPIPTAWGDSKGTAVRLNKPLIYVKYCILDSS